MKKLLLLPVITLLLASCKNDVEIIVKSDDSTPYIGANVYITLEDLSDIERYSKAYAQDMDQFYLKLKYTARYTPPGEELDSEEIDQKVIQEFNDRHERYLKSYNEGFVKEQYSFPYVTKQFLDSLEKKYTDRQARLMNNPDASGVTNSIGVVNVKLKDGHYYICIKDGYEKRKISSFDVSGNCTRVFTLE